MKGFLFGIKNTCFITESTENFLIHHGSIKRNLQPQKNVFSAMQHGNGEVIIAESVADIRRKFFNETVTLTLSDPSYTLREKYNLKYKLRYWDKGIKVNVIQQ